MTATLPDNAINKELRARLNNLDVNGTSFPFFVGRTGDTSPSNYFLVNTQLNGQQSTKCGRGWLNSTEIQVVVTLPRNTGSKKMLTDATNELIQALEAFALPGSGLSVSNQQLNVENQLTEINGTDVIYRNIIRFETRIN